MINNNPFVCLQDEFYDTSPTAQQVYEDASSNL